MLNEPQIKMISTARTTQQYNPNPNHGQPWGGEGMQGEEAAESRVSTRPLELHSCLRNLDNALSYLHLHPGTLRIRDPVMRRSPPTRPNPGRTPRCRCRRSSPQPARGLPNNARHVETPETSVSDCNPSGVAVSSGLLLGASLWACGPQAWTPPDQ